LIGTKFHIKEKLAISFFGIRGIGSFFYLAFALSTTYFPLEKELWSLVSFIVLISIIIHGITASPVMHKIESELPNETGEDPAKDNV
ncbi:MAG: cation:proton antiporter, partial [Chitinophagaceae bacterium]|nr:cation:proton antiporter [Chitinophagaceae bacterium]